MSPVWPSAKTGVPAGADADRFHHGRFTPGVRLNDRYRIVGRLGAGGMGEVYRADDLTIGQAVALKFLPERLERDRSSLDRFMSEIRTARAVAHPNVCHMYDVGEVDGRAFLSMEYVDGEDLRALLRRIGRLPEDKGLEIARQLCAGLAAIHDRGLLHRDLKPANVMLDGRGRVRLTDFGLSTPAAAACAPGEIAGTPAYMAPEQLAGRPLSPATDIYALGLVLSEIFTGERVHKGDRIIDRTDEAWSTPATSVGRLTDPSAHRLDPALRQLIERCLDPDPVRRPRSALAVAAALPGGDPLAAALAAGETPSPRMVADAGAEGGLSLRIAVPLLAALLVLAGLVAWGDGGRGLVWHVSFPNSPEILASRARDTLQRLGYTDPIVGSACSFVASGLAGAYGRWLAGRGSANTRWAQIAHARPPLVGFTCRTSPAPLRPVGAPTAPGDGLGVSRTNPPMTTAGMTYCGSRRLPPVPSSSSSRR